MAKYGKLNAPSIPDMSADHAAIDDLLEKGLLTPEKAQRKHNNLKRRALLFLVYTNGGYTQKTKGTWKYLDKMKKLVLKDPIPDATEAVEAPTAPI